jgi:hypothetical protein
MFDASMFRKELHQQHLELLDRLGRLQAEAMTSHDEEAMGEIERRVVGIWR